MVVSLCGTVATAGYNYRKVEELNLRVTALEQAGSVQAQLAARDIEWIKTMLQDINNKIDRHMLQDTDKK